MFEHEFSHPAEVPRAYCAEDLSVLAYHLPLPIGHIGRDQALAILERAGRDGLPE
jgi:hypothetical protein